MTNDKNLAGSFNPLTLAVAALAICATGAVILLAPAGASSNASSTSTASQVTVADGTGYFPAQYVNQATEIESQPATF